MLGQSLLNPESVCSEGFACRPRNERVGASDDPQILESAVLNRPKVHDFLLSNHGHCVLEQPVPRVNSSLCFPFLARNLAIPFAPLLIRVSRRTIAAVATSSAFGAGGCNGASRILQ